MFKDLETLTPQQIFDEVARHLARQNEKSSIGLDPSGVNNCLYRSPEGLKCAVGYFISDDEYTDELEGDGIGVIANLLDTNLGVGKEMLLSDLQGVHDSYNPDEWLGGLRVVANEYALAQDSLAVFGSTEI